MELRDYQTRTVQAVHEGWNQGARRVLLVLPTGAGKSITATAATEGMDPLWLVPTTALREQSPGRSVTIQSLLSGRRPECGVLIADEAHHLSISAPVWHSIATHYPKMLGLSATPCHASGAGLSDLFDVLIAGASYSELLADGYLCACKVVMPAERPDEETGLAEHPVKAWLKYAGDRKGLAFFGRVELARRFAASIPRAAVVYGDQPEEERAAAMASFRSGDVRVLASVSTVSEGWDVPDASICLLAVQPGHEGSYLQRVGRVLRPAPGKSEALLIDLPGAVYRYGLPTEDRTYSLTGTPIRRADAAQALSQCLQCGAVYPSAPACPECGWVRLPKVRQPRIWGVPMEIVDPSALTPEQHGKLKWKDKMLADDDTRLTYLLGKAKHAGHAAALHKQIFGAPLPREWWGRFPRKSA